MAVDDCETEYHLTRNGWVIGTSYFFSEIDGKEIAPPEDRVLTVVGRIYQRSGWSPDERSLREEWRSPNMSDSELEELQIKYPCPFRR
jgi:hypothetical protein